MPTPNKNEKKSDFVSRCIEKNVKEGKDQKQAAAICYSMWEEKKKKAKATVELGNGEEIVTEDEE